MTLNIRLNHANYRVFTENGIINRAEDILNLSRKVMIVTDSGVPPVYSNTVAGKCRDAFIVTVPQGESSKSIEQYEKILTAMLRNNFTRDDAVIAVGGGVVGDLAGFCASSYMRGVDFYNIPTTLLSQVDSAIGGKTALNLAGTKNAVGAFYQPKCVLIDPDLLDTLSDRLFYEGMAEVIKMALTSDADLFELIERGGVRENITEIISRALMIKKHFVESDERERGIRKMLNFGHTLGHAIEAQNTGLYHGECVALGMPPLCGDKVRGRLTKLLKSFNLPTRTDTDPDAIYNAVIHDKKVSGDSISVVRVDEIGHGFIETVKLRDMRRFIDKLYESAI